MRTLIGARRKPSSASLMKPSSTSPATAASSLSTRVTEFLACQL